MAGLGFSPEWKTLRKVAMEVVDFGRGFFCSQNTKEQSGQKIRRKVRHPKKKIARAKSPKAPGRPNNPLQNPPTNPPVNLKYTHGFF